MLKFLLAAAPYLLKAPTQTSKKQIARSFTALVLFAMSGMMFAAATFIFVTSLYGAAIGFLTVSGLFLLAGLIMFLKAKTARRTPEASPPQQLTTDPIASMLPTSVLSDPVVTKLTAQISAKPVAAALSAMTIGILLAREIMKD